MKQITKTEKPDALNEKKKETATASKPKTGYFTGENNLRNDKNCNIETQTPPSINKLR